MFRFSKDLSTETQPAAQGLKNRLVKVEIEAQGVH
jgi:hypothetical protein